jgi:hypothetical protein
VPVTHFCESDGSRKNATQEQRRAGDTDPHVGRVVLAHDGASMCVLGGRMDHMRDAHERHSYESELASFHDHLADTAGTVTVIVTDCLSGSMAGSAYAMRVRARATAPA